MTRKECFVVEESPYQPGKYIIYPKHENFYLKSTSGSYNVIYARLFNLSYAQYLRMCRDLFEAEIIGKNTLYPVAYFSKRLAATTICKLLNARANYVLWEREYGAEYEMKKKVVEEFDRRVKELKEKHGITE